MANMDLAQLDRPANPGANRNDDADDDVSSEDVDDSSEDSDDDDDDSSDEVKPPAKDCTTSDLDAFTDVFSGHPLLKQSLSDCIPKNLHSVKWQDYSDCVENKCSIHHAVNLHHLCVEHRCEHCITTHQDGAYKDCKTTDGHNARNCEKEHIGTVWCGESQDCLKNGKVCDERVVLVALVRPCPTLAANALNAAYHLRACDWMGMVCSYTLVH